MDVAAVDLFPPAVPDFNLTVAGGGLVADYKMISEPVTHPAHMAVVVIEDARVALPGAAGVHHAETPPLAQDGSVIDFAAHGTAQVFVALPEKVKGQEGKAARLLVA